jgi:hypothetical protein
MKWPSSLSSYDISCIYKVVIQNYSHLAQSGCNHRLRTSARTAGQLGLASQRLQEAAADKGSLQARFLQVISLPIKVPAVMPLTYLPLVLLLC